MQTTIDLKDMLSNALLEGMSYNRYKTTIDELMAKGKSTGHIQNDDMLNYSKLSQRRMKRWDKTFKLAEEDKAFFETFDTSVSFLVISEGWCGDAAHALPIINSIVESSKNLELKIILRDDNDDLMQEFLTNGGKSIPKLIALDNENNVLFTWGPRPTEATRLVNDYKNTHGKLTPEFKEELQKWYNKDKGQSIVKDIKHSLAKL